MNDNDMKTVPCPYMVCDKNHYHTCAILCMEGHNDNTVCMWFFDLGGYDCGTFEVDLRSKTVVSDLNCPDVWREKMKHNPRKENVPKLCPKGYTWDQIDAKIKAFDPWLGRGTHE